jgi:hypothetical protein
MRDGPIEYYTRENEELEIGSLAIRKIQYGFWKGRFVEARITVMSNIEAAVRELRLLFGEECAAERRDVRWFHWEDIYSWEKPGTKITLTRPVAWVGKESDECTVTVVSKRIMEEMKMQDGADYSANE